VPAADAGAYKSPFFQDFIHLNVAMMTSNNALNVGLRMCGWDDSIVKYFLLGNPLVYWMSTASLGVVGLMVVWYAIRWQRGYDELKQSDIDQIHYAALYPILGWVLHYLPFVAMARVTYVHHYYPALYFAILTLGFVVDWTLRNQIKTLQYAAYGVLYAATIGLYIYFMPICWGMAGPNMNYNYMKWFENWRVTD
jgi:dolichyl-phosphate-mannose-protein mannosyltransferase